MRRYLDSEVRTDSEGMWQCLSRQTQSRLTKKVFVQRVAENTAKYVRVTHILSIRCIKCGADSAVIEYQVQGDITAAEARRLRRYGDPGAKAGAWMFRPTRREVVREQGQWRMEVLSPQTPPHPLFLSPAHAGHSSRAPAAFRCSTV